MSQRTGYQEGFKSGNAPFGLNIEHFYDANLISECMSAYPFALEAVYLSSLVCPHASMLSRLLRVLQGLCYPRIRVCPVTKKIKDATSAELRGTPSLLNHDKKYEEKWSSQQKHNCSEVSIKYLMKSATQLL